MSEPYNCLPERLHIQSNIGVKPLVSECAYNCNVREAKKQEKGQQQHTEQTGGSERANGGGEDEQATNQATEKQKDRGSRKEHHKGMNKQGRDFRTSPSLKTKPVSEIKTQLDSF